MVTGRLWATSAGDVFHHGCPGPVWSDGAETLLFINFDCASGSESCFGVRAGSWGVAMCEIWFEASVGSVETEDSFDSCLVRIEAGAIKDDVYVRIVDYVLLSYLVVY